MNLEETYTDTYELIPADETPNLTNDNISAAHVFKKISALAIPMGLSFTFSFEVVISVILLNSLGKTNDDVAAATLVSILMNTVCVLGVSPLFAVSILLSNKLGEWRTIIAEQPNKLPLEELNNKKQIISSFNANALLIAAVVSPFAFLALFFSKNLLVSVLQQNPNVADIAQDFLRPYSFAIPGIMSRMVFEQIMFAFGKTKPAMWIGLSSLAIGSLVSGLLGFGVDTESVQITKMGSQGVALGFLLEAYLTAIAYGLYVKFSPDIKEFEFFKSLITKIKNNKNQLSNILSVSQSISLTVSIELAMILAVGVFSGLIGTREQSAMSYNMQFVYFEFIMLSAFSFSCAQEISRELGAKNQINANKIAKYGLLTTLCYLTPLPLLFAAYPQALEAISGGAPNDISKILKHLVPIMSAGVILDSIRYNLLQQLRGMGDLSAPNIIAILGMFSGILLAGILGLETSLKIDGVALGYTLGVGLTAGGLYLRWKNQIKTENIGRGPNNSDLKTSCLSLLSMFEKEKGVSNIDTKTLLEKDPEELTLGTIYKN